MVDPGDVDEAAERVRKRAELVELLERAQALADSLQQFVAAAHLNQAIIAAQSELDTHELSAPRLR